jgi:hypothetical protein
MRHELTHVLTKIAGEGPYGDLPAWLDEGMATISEEDWQSRRGAVLDWAIENDRVLPLRGMEATSNRPDQVDLFYGQSAAIVTWLIEEYGPEKMAELFSTFKAGSNVENALVAVYGVGRDAIDDAWRASVGLPPRERGEDRSTEIEDEVISGPQIAGEEDQSDAAAGARDDQQQSSQQQAAEPAAGDQAASDTGSQSQADQSQQAEAVSGSSRSQAEIDERRAEIDRRQQERRPAPVFDVAGEFRWEYVLVGVAGALLLISAVWLVRVLTPRSERPSDL